jgi:hypothetical protein
MQALTAKLGTGSVDMVGRMPTGSLIVKFVIWVLASPFVALDVTGGFSPPFSTFSRREAPLQVSEY